MPIGPSHDLVGMDEAFDAPPGAAFRLLPYPLLAAAFVLTVLESLGDVSRPLVLIGALTAAAAVVSAVALLPRHTAAGHQRWYLAYLLVRSALTAALIAVAPWFGIYAWFGYVEAIRYFRPPRVYPLVVLNAAVTSLSYVGGVPTSAGTAVFYGLVTAASSVLVSFFAREASRSRDRDLERSRTLSALTVANTRLAQALTDNEALQEQLITQAREAGVLDERTRLAGEIHDTLAQSLAGVITQLDAAGAVGAPGSGRADHVARARALAADGLAEARRSLHALRPEPLERSRLADALGEAAGRWSTTTGVPVAVDVTGDVVALCTDAEVALLRVAQEGLANVARHARASKVGVTLSYLGDVVLLDVRDDGVGFVPDTLEPVGGEHVGLSTMRERLRRIGGRLEVESETGGGTALVAKVPAR